MSRKQTLEMAELALAKGAYRECLLSLRSLLDKTTLLSTEGGDLE